MYYQRNASNKTTSTSRAIVVAFVVPQVTAVLDIEEILYITLKWKFWNVRTKE